MKQSIKIITFILVFFLGINVNTYAFVYSLSKDYAKEKMVISGECQADDCVSVVIMTSGITPESAWENILDEDKTTYIHHYYRNGIQHSITVSGGNPLNVAFIADVMADEKGEFKIEAGIEDTGMYDVFVTSKNESETKITEGVSFVDNDTYSAAVETLNNGAKKGDAAAFTEILKSKLSDLGFDEIDTANTEMSDVSHVLFNEINNVPLDKDNFENNLIIYKNCVAAFLLNKKQVKDITGNIKELIAEDSLYPYFEKYITEDVHRTYFTSRMSGKNITTVQTLKELCTDAVILTVVKYPNGYMSIKDVLSEIGEAKGISPLSNNNSIYSNLAGNDYNSVDSLITAYKSNLNNSNGGSGSSSGGSGSSSGGSGSSSVTKKNTSSGVYVTGTSEQNNTEIKNMRFIDLDTVMWAYEAISTLADKNIINGKSEDRFVPNDNVTREEFVKLVICALGENNIEAKESGFTDVIKDAWYCDYVNRGYETGIINGYEDGRFGVGDNITRQDIAVIIYNALKYKAVETEKGKLSFMDSGNISDYAKEAVSALSASGIINGYDDGSFQPKSYATRAEAAQLIFKMLKVLK